MPATPRASPVLPARSGLPLIFLHVVKMDPVMYAPTSLGSAGGPPERGSSTPAFVPGHFNNVLPALPADPPRSNTRTSATADIDGQSHAPAQPSNKRRRTDSSRLGVTYPRKRAVAACRLCRSRKVKCNNARPSCGSCIASKAQCVYDDPEDYSAYVLHA